MEVALSILSVPKMVLVLAGTIRRNANKYVTAKAIFERASKSG